MMYDLDGILDLEDCNKLELKINHSHGGINYYNYQQEKPGYYLHFNPCFIKECSIQGWHSITYPHLMENKYSFKIHLFEKYRFSKKTLEKLNKVLDENGEKILELYKNRDDTKLFAGIKEIFKEFM